jgi:hypothetical protein
MICAQVKYALALAIAIAVLLPTSPVHAQAVWSGLTKTFTKAAFSNHTLPQNQDMLTPNVILTRGDAGGLINIAAESLFNLSASPVQTKWATNLNNAGKSISAANWQDLTFTNWLDSYGGSGSQGSLIAGRDAVVQLVPDNIYLDLRFTSWGSSRDGGYSYMRAEAPVTPLNDGDYNENGVVDAADYVVWRKALGETVANQGDGADGNSSGMIDSGDYDFWRSRFGIIVSPASLNNAAVPEPTSTLLLLICLTFRTVVRAHLHRRNACL